LVLNIVPYTNANNDVLWQCGSAASPSSATVATSAVSTGTTVSAQYLPTSCHS
jgi:hypothetical protein